MQFELFTGNRKKTHFEYWQLIFLIRTVILGYIDNRYLVKPAIQHVINDLSFLICSNLSQCSSIFGIKLKIQNFFPFNRALYRGENIFDLNLR